MQPVSDSAQPQYAETQLVDAARRLDDAQAQISTWTNEVEPKIVGSGGETVSMSRDMVDRLAYLSREERVTPAEIESMRIRISQLQDTIKAAGKAPLALSQIQEVQQLCLAAMAANDEWDTAVSGAKAILAAASSLPASESQLDLPNRIEQANRQAAMDDIDAQRLRKETEALAEAERIARDQAILEKSLSPEVANSLAPFLEARDVQPRLSGSTVRFYDTLFMQPMSLGALYALGAIEDSMHGLKRLAAAGGHRDLAEPKWSVHSQPGNWTAQDKEMLQQAQDYLRDYGAILVREGRLAP